MSGTTADTNRIKDILKTRRIILHIDLDAFYAQVEHVRLNIPLEQPLCVQQWNGLIAVNYAARAKGIKRHETVGEALQKCPELRLVHVATYAPNETEPRYREKALQSTHKRASIDEAYIDLTEDVNRMIITNLGSYVTASSTHGYDHNIHDSDQEHIHDEDGGPLVDWNKLEGTNVVGMENSSETEIARGWADLQLYLGAQICAQMRKAVMEELGYTCSAGIAHNKTLAKLVSSLHKPNKQTVLPESQVLNFMRDMPFQKIRLLGGKLGDEIEQLFSVEKCSDLWSLEEPFLKKKLGDQTGTWLYNIVRGICHEEVVVRNVQKSMMAAKSFRPSLKTHPELKNWVGILSAELFTRLQDDFDLNHRWPKTLTLHYKLSDNSERSRSGNFIPRSQFVSPDTLVAKVLEMLRQEKHLFPCQRMSIQVGGFESLERAKDIRGLFAKSASSHSEVPSDVLAALKKEDERAAESEKRSMDTSSAAAMQQATSKNTIQHLFSKQQEREAAIPPELLEFLRNDPEHNQSEVNVDASESKSTSQSFIHETTLNTTNSAAASVSNIEELFRRQKSRESDIPPDVLAWAREPSSDDNMDSRPVTDQSTSSVSVPTTQPKNSTIRHFLQTAATQQQSFANESDNQNTLSDKYATKGKGKEKEGQDINASPKSSDIENQHTEFAYTCKECGKQMSWDEADEHADWHFALKLANESTARSNEPSTRHGNTIKRPPSPPSSRKNGVKRKAEDGGLMKYFGKNS